MPGILIAIPTILAYSGFLPNGIPTLLLKGGIHDFLGWMGGLWD
jgi:hypothetical protein